MKKILKTIGWALLIALLVIQFFHPAKNKAMEQQINSIATLHQIPDDVNIILNKACNDCHSNNTIYPWYSKIQPVDWWLNDHIIEGKRHLNLDDMANRPAWLRYHKMEEIIEQVKEGEMPLNSYTWIHRDAILNQNEKAKLTDWAQSVMDEMKKTLPPDSLVRPKRPQQPPK